MSLLMTRAYRWIVGLIRALTWIFFKRVEVVGLDNLPAKGGGILISWHPNGMVDPLLILARFPRAVRFGARHGLFRWPLLGWAMRALGTVPVYRAADVERRPGADRKLANTRSIDALAQAVADGSFSALFPEGLSHDAPHPVELKLGAARLYYRARQLARPDAPLPVIIPVGLHYDAKSIFGSRVLLAFHPPLELPQELDQTPPADEPAAAARARSVELTAEFERELNEVAHATDSWTLHRAIMRTRSLVHAERARRAARPPREADMGERTIGFAQVRAGYYARIESDPVAVEQLRRRVSEYDGDLQTLGLEDHELDAPPRLASPWLPVLLLLQVIVSYLLLPPILLVGVLINGPAALVSLVITRLASAAVKDVATLKILIGAVLYPGSWVAAGLLVAWGQVSLHEAYPTIPEIPVLAGLIVGALGALGGAVALTFRRILTETWRALRVRLTRKRRWYAVQRLLAERADLFDATMALAEGLDLPESVVPRKRR
jgi:1-acyl-sn-glycerol-3-phosphate acyltransferase